VYPKKRRACIKLAKNKTEKKEGRESKERRDPKNESLKASSREEAKGKGCHATPGKHKAASRQTGWRSTSAAKGETKRRGARPARLLR
jgi:hypothetical protein